VPEPAADSTVLHVPLTETLATGAETEITLAFETMVPLDSDGSYGILNRDRNSGAWILADWYPIVAGYEAGTGWELDPPTSFGDPTFGDVALYDVVMDAPAGWELVTSGSEVATSASGRHHWVAGPARDFSVVANPGGVTTRGDANGTTVSVFAESGDEAAAEIVLATAVEALEIYGDIAGLYPYRELDFVTTPLAGAVGVAWVGIIFLDLERFDSSPASHEALRFTVAHEVGHQWWGGIVGVNSNDHTFMTEGLTNALTILFIEETSGEVAASTALQVQIADPYLDLLDRSGDQIVNIPIVEGQQGRGAIWYGKATLGFLAIRQRIGDAAFRAALGMYGDAFAQRIADPSDLLAAFEHASGEKLDELWNFWFESDGVTAADVAVVVDAV
jgi:aminopeptidase N